MVLKGRGVVLAGSSVMVNDMTLYWSWLVSDWSHAWHTQQPLREMEVNHCYYVG